MHKVLVTLTTPEVEPLKIGPKMRRAQNDKKNWGAN